MVNLVTGDVHERAGHVQAKVVTCRTSVGDLETVEGEIAAVNLDHRLIAGYRILNFACASGSAGKGDIFSSSSDLLNCADLLP